MPKIEYFECHSDGFPTVNSSLPFAPRFLNALWLLQHHFLTFDHFMQSISISDKAGNFMAKYEKEQTTVRLQVERTPSGLIILKHAYLGTAISGQLVTKANKPALVKVECYDAATANRRYLPHLQVTPLKQNALRDLIGLRIQSNRFFGVSYRHSDTVVN